jgi:formyltetrahydrofolate-dependent phosphoribosylglycinamide formyltransferase
VSASPVAPPFKVAVFASGNGTTFQALVEAGRQGRIPAEVVLLIASRKEVPALALAASLGVDRVVLDERVIGQERADGEALAELTARGVALVVLAGYLRKVGPQTLAAFAGRMLNTHPAPLPRFGGKGMFGQHVHRAVLEAGVPESAATVHLVDTEYDTGPVVAATSVPVLPGDDVAALQARVQLAERELLVRTVADFASATATSEPLPGSMGNGGKVFRRGGTVLRPTGQHTEATLALLTTLARTGFIAPVPLGATDDGQQAFTWIDGDVAVPPFPDWAMTDDALRSAARLVRDYHSAVAGLSLPPDLQWSEDGVPDPNGGPIICHNDVCPENVVFRDGEAVALLDFDFAAPGRPLWDLANLARMWCPLRPADLAVEGMAELDPLHRLGVLARGYGLAAADHAEFVGVILEAGQVGMEFVRRRLSAREPAFVHAWEPRGGEVALDRIVSWLVAHQDAMLSALELGA